MICEDCKKEKPDVKETTCPYAEDIHGTVQEATLCNECYYQRCMDI